MTVVSGFTPYAENLLLDSLLGSEDPASIFVAMATSVSGDTVTGEPTIGTNNYSRVEVVNNATNFPAAEDGSKTVYPTITFPTSSGAWNEGAPLNVVVLFDAATGGHAIAWGTLSVPPTVNGANIIVALTGDQDLTLSITPTSA